MPGARCTRGLVCKNVQKTHTSIQVQTGASRHSLRNGFTAYGGLSPAIRICLSPSPRGSWLSHPVGPASPPKDLTPTMRRQDHTLLPYAAPVFALRLRRALPVSALGFNRALAPVVCALCSLTDRSPPCQHDHAPDAAASTASRPNVRDDGQRPSTGTGWRRCRGDLGVASSQISENQKFCLCRWLASHPIRVLASIRVGGGYLYCAANGTDARAR